MQLDSEGELLVEDGYHEVSGYQTEANQTF